MKDLIEREKAIRIVKTECNPYGAPTIDYKSGLRVIEILEQISSAEPKWKMGKWLVTDAYPHRVYCSKCFVTFAQTQWGVWEDGSLPRNYCPNCGARMDGEGKEKEE